MTSYKQNINTNRNTEGKRKIKVFPVHNMRSYREWRHRSTHPKLDRRWRRVVSYAHASAALLPGKEPPVPNEYETVWAPQLIGAL
jgi:hypothetical protein